MKYFIIFIISLVPFHLFSQYNLILKTGDTLLVKDFKENRESSIDFFSIMKIDGGVSQIAQELVKKISPVNPTAGKGCSYFYVGSNEVIYHIGDTIILGHGSMPNGDFKCLQLGGWLAVTNYDSRKGSDQFNVNKNYSGFPVILKKIKKVEFKGIEKFYFVVGGGNITNYNLYIEDAIEFCEIKNCKKDQISNQNNTDKYELLKKAKELFDQGILNKEEYEIEKGKILKKDP